jgi:hypothetical protein
VAGANPLPAPVVFHVSMFVLTRSSVPELSRVLAYSQGEGMAPASKEPPKFNSILADQTAISAASEDALI